MPLEFLSLPRELIDEIIELCSKPDCCHLRASCKRLNELADPIVFRRLRLSLVEKWPGIAEHQIIELETQTSKACEFTKEIEFFGTPDGTEQSWSHNGHCGDLRLHLPTAISALRNITSFRWVVSDNDPEWLVDSLAKSIASLPKLTELNVHTSILPRAPIPLGLVGNLSKLSIQYGNNANTPLFTSQVATVIANSPHLKSLDMTYWDAFYVKPTLCELFSKLTPQNPLSLEHLRMSLMDATVDRAILPHLTHLNSFHFRAYDVIPDRHPSITRSVWKSFLVNKIKLSNVIIEGPINKEMMLYLSSCSGLKSLSVNGFTVPQDKIIDDIKDMLFTEVLLNHVDSLQTLKIVTSVGNPWFFDHATSRSILKCLKLRELHVDIDGGISSMTVQRLLDTVAHLPELRILRFRILDRSVGESELTNFKPSQGLRYVEELESNLGLYVLEKEGGLPMRYRKILPDA